MDSILLLGVVSGMRSMTGIAALCWATWLGFIPEYGWGTEIQHILVVLLLTLAALAEYVADTMPKTPRRTAFRSALGRLILGAVVGLFVAKAIDEPLAGGVIFGAIGAIIGTWGGFFVRMSVARLFRRDLPAALLESASAIAIAVLALARLHHGIVIELQKLAR